MNAYEKGVKDYSDYNYGSLVHKPENPYPVGIDLGGRLW